MNFSMRNMYRPHQNFWLFITEVKRAIMLIGATNRRKQRNIFLLSMPRLAFTNQCYLMQGTKKIRCSVQNIGTKYVVPAMTVSNECRLQLVMLVRLETLISRSPKLKLILRRFHSMKGETKIMMVQSILNNTHNLKYCTTALVAT